MIKELLIYPDDRILTPCTDVRIFDSKLWDVIENMKDTMEANSLDALSAIQIAIPYNIVVIKHHGVYNEYINPRIIRVDGKIQNTESTPYYPNIKQRIPRYAAISIIYDDKHGNTHTALIDEPWLSGTIQRKIDYLFGGTFLSKLPKAQSDMVIDTLAKGGMVVSEEICPLFSPKDYFVSFADKLLILSALSLFAPLTTWGKNHIAAIIMAKNIFLISVIFVMIGFFFFAQWQAKRYKQCTSCQIGNNIGVIVKRFVAVALLGIASYFILG